MALHHLQLKGQPPKYPHISVLMDDDPVFVWKLHPIKDVVCAMEAAGLSQEEIFAFEDALIGVITREMLKWVTLVQEVNE